MPITARKFIDSVESVGIFSAAAAETIRGKLSAEALDAQAESLARDLIREGKLTKYQAANIYQGRAKSLIFGEYIVLDKLGQGGMGQVFKAQHRRMKRVVALKVLPPHATSSAKSVQRFYQEVEVAAKLTHPNIVTSYDAGEARGLHFLVMEYVEGQDLSAYVAKKGPLSIEQAMNCIMQAARGLAYAHSLGIVHRDIKPSNLLLDRQGTVKILDMGLARVERPMSSPDDEGGVGELTDDGQMMGTVDYIAPEQAVDTRTADARADIYSLGCTLYRIIVGKGVYTGATAIQKILAHREAAIPSLVDARSDVPYSLDQLFQRMLVKDPAQRIQPITEVVTALEQMLSGIDPEESSVVVAADAIDHEIGDFFKSLAASGISGSSVTKRMHEGTPSETLIPVLSNNAPGVEPQSKWEQLTDKYPLIAPLAVACGVAFAILGIASFLLLGNRPSQPVAKPNTATIIAKPEKSISKEGSKVKPVEPTQPEKSETTKSAAPLDFSKPVNLLKLIDVQRDAATLGWQFDGRNLTVPSGRYARLQIPVAPPPEYDVEMTVERLSGNNSLDFGLVLAGKQPLVQIGGANDVSGISLVDGKTADQNETRFSGPTLLTGPNLVVYSVRKSGFLVRCNNKPVVSWTGDNKRLASFPPMSVFNGEQLFVGANGSSFRITKLDLLPPAKDVEAMLATRSDPVQTPAKTTPLPLVGTVDLLAMIDAAKHGQNGNWTRQGTMLVVDRAGGGYPYALAPFAAPEEYDVAFTVETTNATQPIGIILPMGNRQVAVRFEAARAGIDKIDNEQWYKNSSTRRGEFLANGKPSSFTAAVRKNQFVVTIDGRPALAWTDTSRLSQGNDIVNLPQPQLAVFGNATTKFHKLEISPPALPTPSFSPIDVLASIDPKRDAIKLDCKRDGRDLLLAPSATDGFLLFPAFRPNEFVITIEAERLSGQGGLNISLPFEGGRPAALFDGYSRSVSAIEPIRGAYGNNDNNPTLFRETCLLLPDRSHKLVCSVGHDSIQGFCDGRQIFQRLRKDGQFSDHSVFPPDSEPLFIHSRNTGWRISKIEIAPLDWKRLPVPPTDALVKSRETVSGLIDGTKSKSASAEGLLFRAAQTLSDPALRYVLLEESLNLAGEAGDLPLAMSAAEDLSSIFEVDSREFEKRLVADVFKAARSADAKLALLYDSLKWLDRAVNERRFELAADLRTAAATLKVGAPEFQKDFQRELKTLGVELGVWKAEQDAYLSALEALAAKPDDSFSAAHATVGKYLCLVAGDWKAGLVHLDQGADAAIQPLAKLQVENPFEVDNQAALADRWWDLYEKTTGPMKWLYMELAADWYQRAGAKATGKLKISIDQRRQKLAGERKTSGSAFSERHPLDAIKIGEHWYKFYSNLSGWRAAAETCEKMGGQLLCLDTPAEEAAVAQYILSQNSKTESVSVWIGATDQDQEGTFRWLDGTLLTYQNWAKNEPNNGGGTEDWTVLTATLQNGKIDASWKDASSSNPPDGGNYPFVCEWDR